MVDYVPPSFQFPQESPAAPLTAAKGFAINHYVPPQSVSSLTHSRTRTSSSGALPASGYEDFAFRNPYHCHPQDPYSIPSKLRTDSFSTATTVSQGRTSTSSTNLRRSGSMNTSSSFTHPSSAYVANLRRQKATVWCDRAQPEDPRLLAAQKAAKLKAAMEVIGSSSSAALKGAHGLGSGSSSTSSMRGGKFGRSSNTNIGIGTGSMVGGPPPRLSATEANGDSSDEDEIYVTVPGLHRRSGSGRSSLNSNHRRPNRSGSNPLTAEHRSSSYSALNRQSSKGSSPSYSPNVSTIELAEPPLQHQHRPKSKSPPQLVSPLILEERTPDVRHASSYFDVQNRRAADNDALKRRGSLDEGAATRTMTMGGLRLVVANPD